MKKVFTLLLALLTVVMLTACTEKTTSTTLTLSSSDNATSQQTFKSRPTVENEIDTDVELTPGSEYSITFWHIWGEAKSKVLATQLTEFKKWMKDKYDVDVEITDTAQSNYATLLDKTEKAIAGGSSDGLPNLVIGYPDHFASYKKALALVDLDPYCDSLNYGVDRNDYVYAYMAENNQFDGVTYSLPLSKSTEVMVYNKSALDAMNITIPYDKPMTWSELFALWSTVQTYSDNYADFQYLINYDSTDNMFINFCRQMNAKYTTQEGTLEVTDQSTVNMLTLVQTMIKNKYLSVPINYSSTASYGSDYFKQQKMLFTIGSSAGVSYDVPTETSEDVQYLFEAGVAMIPQFISSLDQENETYSMSAVQQGPNICMLDTGSDEDKLVSWLLIRYLTYMDQYDPTNPEANEDGFVEGMDNSARFAIETHYFPVTTKAEESAVYKEFLGIAEKYFKSAETNNGKYTSEGLTEKEKALLIYSEAAYVAKIQNSWSKYDPAFAASSTLQGSATIRTYAGTCIEKIANDTDYSVISALQEFVTSCSIN